MRGDSIMMLELQVLDPQEFGSVRVPTERSEKDKDESNGLELLFGPFLGVFGMSKTVLIH